jgi:hypothetical protein
MSGQMSFFDPAGPIEHSGLCPDFPKLVKMD